jgi:hypothetical protein
MTTYHTTYEINNRILLIKKRIDELYNSMQLITNGYKNVYGLDSAEKYNSNILPIINSINSKIKNYEIEIKQLELILFKRNNTDIKNIKPQDSKKRKLNNKFIMSLNCAFKPIKM